MIRSFLIVVVFFFISFSISSCWPFTKESEAESTQPIPVQAPDLLEAYLTAPADQKDKVIYHNRLLLVSGVVARVKPDEGIVILYGKRGSMVSNWVECYLDRSAPEYEKIGQLVLNQGIVIEGVNGGYDFGTVKLKNSVIKGF